MKNTTLALVASVSLIGTVVSADGKGTTQEPINYIAVDSLAEYIHSRVVKEIEDQMPVEVVPPVIDSELIMEKQRLSQLYADVLAQNKSKDAQLKELGRALSNQLSLGAVTQRYYFATDSRELSGEQYTEASAILAAVSKMGDIKVIITGRADPRGDDKYNELLAQDRILFVKNLAIEKGIPFEVITTFNLGEVGGKQANSEDYFFQRHLTLELKKVRTEKE